MSEPYKDGFAAFNRFISRFDNPYGAHRLNWAPAREWDDGWVRGACRQSQRCSMSRQVPIRYRAEPTQDGQGYVRTASGGGIVAYCPQHSDAVMIADALNRANGVGPPHPSAEEVNARRALRGLDPIDPGDLERYRRNADAMTYPKGLPSIGERLDALEAWRKRVEAEEAARRKWEDEAIAAYDIAEEDGA